jgi:hypothetical protein
MLCQWRSASQAVTHSFGIATQNPGLQRLRTQRGIGCNHSEKPFTSGSALTRWRQAIDKHFLV